MCVIDRFIRMAGFDSDLPVLQKLLDFPVAPLVHIVGMNMADSGIESVKVYFVLADISVSTLLAIATAFRRLPEFGLRPRSSYQQSLPANGRGSWSARAARLSNSSPAWSSLFLPR